MPVTRQEMIEALLKRPRKASGRACRRCAPVDAHAGRLLQVSIEGRRHDVAQWSRICRVMSERPLACAQCMLLTRWSGLYWCGAPWPVRQWRRWIAPLLEEVTGGLVPAMRSTHDAGCACCLNVKWRMLTTPRTWWRMAVATVRSLAMGEPWEWEETEAACPFGRWPTAL